jgi:rfaE bifunctional protein nucleotidyltransferase chain/domain
VIDRKYGLKRKVVFTNGCFDILHAGHIRFLQAAKDCGDTLVVGLNTDRSIKRIKGKARPIICQEQRVEVLLGLKTVDFVILFDEDNPLKLIETIKPDILVKGEDWKSGSIIGEEFVESYGGEVIRILFEIDISTSSIIKKILRIIESKGK